MKKVLLGIFGVVALAAAGVAGAVGPTLESLQASSGTTTLYKDIRRTDQLCDRAARTWQSTGDTTFTMTEIITNSQDGARAAEVSGCLSSVRFFRWVGSDLLMYKRQFMDSAEAIIITSQYSPGILGNRANMAGSYTVWQNVTHSTSSGKLTSNDSWTTSYSTVNRNTRTDLDTYPGAGCASGNLTNGDQTFSQTFIWCEGEGNVVLQERQSNSVTGGVIYNKTWVKM